jgi:hypothetical protein
MGAGQDYSKSGIAENKITLGLNVCTHNIRVPYENDTPWGQTEITQHLDSQHIRLHGATLFVPGT